jgi:hypothetical protein
LIAVNKNQVNRRSPCLNEAIWQWSKKLPALAVNHFDSNTAAKCCSATFRSVRHIFPWRGEGVSHCRGFAFRDLFAAETSKLGFRPNDRNNRDWHRGKFAFEFLQLEASTESATASQVQPFFQSGAVMRGSPPSVELHIFIAGPSTPAVPHSGRLSRYSKLYAEAKRGR